MSPSDAMRDRSPLGHVRGVPVHVTTLLVAVHVVAMIVLAIATSAVGWPSRLVFSREAVLAGEAPQLVPEGVEALMAGERIPEAA